MHACVQGDCSGRSGGDGLSEKSLEIALFTPPPTWDLVPPLLLHHPTKCNPAGEYTLLLPSVSYMPVCQVLPLPFSSSLQERPQSFLAWASQVCRKEPLQLTLLVRKWIKWISDSGPSQWFRTQKLDLGNFLAHFRLPFFTSLLSLTSPMEREKIKIQAKSVWRKGKADAKKRMF